MERNQALENSWYPDLETSDPHFDDERTLLSAQPVVPLASVSKARTRRRLMFVGAFVVAALLGAGAALALVRVRQPAVVGSVTEANAATEDTVQQPDAQTPAATETPEVASSSTQQQESANSSPVSAPVTLRNNQPKSRPAHPRSARPVEITIIPDDESSDDGRARLLDQWQERRQRRVNRKPDNNHSSELFRIREIFEGPRRSRRPGY